MKYSITIIGGGNSYTSYNAYVEALQTGPIRYRNGTNKSWKDTFYEFFSMYCPVYIPEMPSKNNAQYDEWCLIFEKHLPLLDEHSIVIGHSLGGIFLAQYFSQNPLKQKVHSLHLVAPDYNEGSFAFDNTHLHTLSQNCTELHLWQSDDDFALELTGGLQYRQDFKHITNAHQHIFTDKGHFFSPSFPELSSYILDTIQTRT